jgi:hypothetical protein
MSKLSIEWIMTLCVILLFIAAFIVAGQRDELKVEAVKRGFAEWVSDHNGNTTFKWREGAK